MKANKPLIILMLFLTSCATYSERYQRADRRHQAETTRLDAFLTETPSERARRILNRRSQFEKECMIIEYEPPLTDVWLRRPEILERGYGDCEDIMFSLGDYALINNVDPELFRYCILHRINKKAVSGYDYHAVLLFYRGCFDGEIVTTTGILSNESFISLEDCYNDTGYYPVVSWNKVDGEVEIYKHEPVEGK